MSNNIYEREEKPYNCRDKSIYLHPFITRRPRARYIIQNNFKTDQNGNFMCDNFKLTHVGNPEKGADAATKNYVDDKINQNISMS